MNPRASSFANCSKARRPRDKSSPDRKFLTTALFLVYNVQNGGMVMFLKRLALASSIVALGFAAFSLPTVAQQTSQAVTFNKDVLPILQKNCQTCHRPG